MGFGKDKFVFLILLGLLQSCSGGRIGNFLESSFNNIEEQKVKENIENNLKDKKVFKSGKNLANSKNVEEQKVKENIENNLKDKKVFKSGKNLAKNKNIEEQKVKENSKNNLKDKKFINSDEKSKNTKNVAKKNISLRKRKYQPQSYKIIFILKDVDPKDPIKELSTILRKSDVNFEIEKIERFFDSKLKSIKKN